MSVKQQVLVCRRPGYFWHLEECEGLTFIHVTVTQKWNRELQGALVRDADAIFDLHGGPLYAMSHDPHGGDYRKLHKFLTLIGFEYLTHAQSGVDGSNQPVYIRQKE